jgi:Fe-S-cluster containining protein
LPVGLDVECLRCGTCCSAPDIKALLKPLGVPCRYLDSSGLCVIYETRPEVCKSYRPDELCIEVAAPTLAERVEKYLRLFGLEGE